jgi:transcriptional regulator with XRE-family HTH domain
VVIYHIVKKKMDSSFIKIKEIRIRRGLSQEQFAKSIGYSRAYVADVETGRTKPSRGMLEAIHRTYGTSIDWLMSQSKILSLVELNKETRNPHIIFVYAFTQEGIDSAEEMLRKLLADTKYVVVDASSLKSNRQLLKKIFDGKGTTFQLWHERLKPMLLNQEIILIIKNMSLSQIPRSGDTIRSVFKIMDDASSQSKSSLILLDFPSYLEKNMQSFGDYVVPIHHT